MIAGDDDIDIHIHKDDWILVDQIYKLDSAEKVKITELNVTKYYFKVGPTALWDTRLGNVAPPGQSLRSKRQDGIQIIAPTVGLPALVPGASVHVDILPANYMDKVWIVDYQQAFKMSLRRVELAGVKVYAPSLQLTDVILTKRWGREWFRPYFKDQEFLVCNSSRTQDDFYAEDPGPETNPP